MSSATYVDDAEQKSRWMVQRETRCPGDTANAMRRLCVRYGLNYTTFWNLRYRKPADMLVSAYLSICAAYEAEVARQEKAFSHEREIAAARTRLGAALLRLADQVDRPHRETLTEKGPIDG